MWNPELNYLRLKCFKFGEIPALQVHSSVNSFEVSGLNFFSPLPPVEKFQEVVRVVMEVILVSYFDLHWLS